MVEARMEATLARRMIPSAVVFAALLTLLAWPKPTLRQNFAAAFCTVANTLHFSERSYGSGGIVRLEAHTPDRASTGIGQNDASIIFQVIGRSDRAEVAIDLRRDLHLPLAICWAALFVLPLRATSRAKMMAASLLVIASYGVLTFELFVQWYFHNAVPDVGVYPKGTGWAWLLDLIQRCLAMPPALRLLTPIACVGALGYWMWQQKWLTRRRGNPAPGCKMFTPSTRVE